MYNWLGPAAMIAALLHDCSGAARVIRAERGGLHHIEERAIARSLDNATLPYLDNQTSRLIDIDGRKFTVRLTPAFEASDLGRLNLAALPSDVPAVSVVNFLPTNTEEFAKIFPAVPPDAALIRRANTALDQLQLIREADAALSIPDLSPSPIYIIIGHNEGGVMKTASGDVKITDLSDDCLRLVKICIFISCRSNAFLPDVPSQTGLDSDIRMSKAIELAVQIDKSITAARLAKLPDDDASQQIFNTLYENGTMWTDRITSAAGESIAIGTVLYFEAHGRTIRAPSADT